MNKFFIASIVQGMLLAASLLLMFPECDWETVLSFICLLAVIKIEGLFSYMRSQGL